ncbi:uncharacterized protein LOC115726341 [Rhodamnia argentea]|uniref:Uncharacterized protein LOC115726341 n=1 Tax=Rhodamnia argentea TaxID=178133 RepID=A0ABM3H6B0_9MYRT|nr:uncharacterized protein LOC115726341 [Rhodamnia argentea]
MADASRVRAHSSPELLAPPTDNVERREDYKLEGVATNIMLLLKLVQDHNEACSKNGDDRKKQRLAGMMTILDDVKTRVQKSQCGGNKREVELRRCYTDLKPRSGKRDKKPDEIIVDEKEKLRKALNASLAARKSLEMMCSSLGKEKEIMAAELTKKVHELNGMEEHLNDLKAQNEMLLAKVKACAVEHKEKKHGGEAHKDMTLQERNKELSEQLLKSLEGYRSLKRKFRDSQEENKELVMTVQELGTEIASGLNLVHSFRQHVAANTEQPMDICEGISKLENLLQCIEMKVSNHRQKGINAPKPKAGINTGKPFLVA